MREKKIIEMVTDEPHKQGLVSKKQANEVITSLLLLLVLPDKAYLTEARHGSVYSGRLMSRARLASVRITHGRISSVRALALLLSRDKSRSITPPPRF